MKSKEEFHELVKEQAREKYFNLPVVVKKNLIFNDYLIAFTAGFESGLEFIQEEFNK